MTGNALVAAPVDLTTPFSGTFLLEDGEALCEAISSGDWVAGGMATFSLAMDGISMALDPIGSLIAMGLGWVMDHIEPLKGWLNDLTGDAGEVAGFAATWQNIAVHLQQTAESLDQSLRGLVSMQGQAADAFRAFHGDAAKHLAAAGEWAGAIGTGMSIASAIVKMVHDMTRDAISTIVGTAASAALTTVVTLGFGAPVAVAQVASKVASLAAKLTKFVTNLLRSVKQLVGLVEELMKLFRKLMNAVGDAIRGLPGRGPDAPSGRPPGGGPPIRDPLAPDPVHPGGPPTTRVPGDPDGGPGTWQPINRGDADAEWKHYQEQVTGASPNADGHIPEYVVPREPGRPVDFDGHTWRGDPPEEVFIEAKHGYDIVVDPARPDFIQQSQIDKFVNQARSQLDVVGGARLEWHFSSEAVADAIRSAFERAGLDDIDVFFTPAR